MEKTKKNEEAGRLIHVRLSKDAHKKLRIRAAEQDTSIQRFVEALIAKELEKRER